MRATKADLIAVLILLSAACASSSTAHQTPQPSSPAPTMTASTAPASAYAVSDLAGVMPSESQFAGWQTATRQDLSGPYTPSSNTNAGEKPAIQSDGFLGGQRLTIGDPGGTGINVVRVSAEVFQTDDLAAAALHQYEAGLMALGYTTRADAGTLLAHAWAMQATNGFIAPQFAMGTAPTVFAFVWQHHNLVVIVRAGGDSSATNAEALTWAELVAANVPGR